MYLPLCGGSPKPNRTRHPRGASLSPRQPRQDQRDSGVSTAVWGGAGSAIIPDPPLHAASLYPKRQGRTGGTRVYPPLCGEELKTGTYTAPPGASLSPKRPTQDWRDRGAFAAMWGGAERSSILDPPRRDIPIPQTARARPEGLRRICRCVGEDLGVQSYPTPHGASLSPKTPGRMGGTWLTAPLCGEELVVQSYPTPKTGRPYPPNGPGRTTGTRVYLPLCGEELKD